MIFEDFGTIFGSFFDFWPFFWRPDLQSVFGWLFGSILEGLGGHFLVHFLDLWGDFVDASAEVENVVWTHYLL